MFIDPCIPARRRPCTISLGWVAIAFPMAVAGTTLAQCPGDLDADGMVGGADISMLLVGWGSADPNTDINGDGETGAADLSILLSRWGACGPSVPAWATLVDALPDPAAVHKAEAREAIEATGYAWRVLHAATGIEMVLIPPGTFMMGCSPTPDSGCWLEESPVHQVTLTRPFYMGRYELTQAQWTAVMGSNPSHFQGSAFPNAAQRPVERLNYNDARAFVQAAGMRLPTEAEWEYSYRAGTTTAFHSMPGYPDGTDDESKLEIVGWIGVNSGMQTKPVGLKPGNGFGLHDMGGNVLEWTNDWFGEYPSDPQVDPVGPPKAWGRVFRSGCWHLGAWLSRVSVRFEDEPEGLRVSDTGMRVAIDP
jgi:formylglycine-generating enzyme required for sulfatase activity